MGELKQNLRRNLANQIGQAKEKHACGNHLVPLSRMTRREAKENRGEEKKGVQVNKEEGAE